MKNYILSLLALALLILAGPLAVAEDDDLVGFDSIVSDLKGSTSVKAEPLRDPLDDVMMHAGLGFATSFLNLHPESGPALSGFLTGIEANFGIDLFSRNWQAETSLRSFNSEKINSEMQVSLKEFDLKVMHSSPLGSKTKLRFGGGLAARYLKADSLLTQKSEYTTPASILDAAIRTQLSSTLSLGAEVSLRNSMISETIDHSAVNAAIRLDAQF